MPINKQELLRRLSFIKYLFLIGSEQSNKPEPLCNVSVLSFHDSIELFLQLASEHYNISGASNFMEYFDKLESKISITQKETMKRFNKARVAIKHHGNMVPKSEIDSFKISCYNFFLENTLSIFNLNFESISLIDLVVYEKTKEHLAIAEKEILGSNYSKAMAEIAIAFWTMIEGYEDTKKKHYGHSPFFFGREMAFQSSFFMGIEDRKLGEFVDKVKESISSMQSAIKILSLGFDYRKFTKFNLLTPSYTRTIGSYLLTERQSNKYNLDEVQWCFDYVIECCVTLQNFDYSLEIDSDGV